MGISNSYLEGNDAVFLPGKIHGAEDDIYIIYYNPDADEGNGCMEIEICNHLVLSELISEVEAEKGLSDEERANKFFSLLPDYFHGKWMYTYSDTSSFSELVSAFPSADFLVGRDGGLVAEYEFIKNWCKTMKRKENSNEYENVQN